MSGVLGYLRAIGIGACMGLFLVSSPARAAISIGGDPGEVSPGNPAAWTSSTNVSVGVGLGHRGELTLSGGSTVLTNYLIVGDAMGAEGNVTVTGSGSAWTSTGLCVSREGAGSLAIASGGHFTYGNGIIASYSNTTGRVTVTGAGSSLASTAFQDIGYDGTGYLTVANGGQFRTKYCYLGRMDGAGHVAITGAGSSWTSSREVDICQGSVMVTDGGQVSFDQSTLIGYGASGVCSATVTGNGSTWTNGGDLYVGYSNAGVLTISDGAKVSSDYCVIGRLAGSSGNVTVTGAGSAMTAAGILYVGLADKGTVSIADGGTVTARSVEIDTASSAINLKVYGNNMLVVGDAYNTGTVITSGQINLYADSGLAAGTYRPISGYGGASVVWFENGGTYNAFGGTWNNSTKTFTVREANWLAAGVVGTLSTGERLMVWGGGQQVEASFGTVTSGRTFSARPATAGAMTALEALLDPNESVFSAWDFTTNLTNSTVLLSFAVGTGATDLKVWHYDGTTWTLFAADDLSYTDSGVASFTVNSFSGYAVTGTQVPEPATLCLLGLGAAAMLRKTRRTPG